MSRWSSKRKLAASVAAMVTVATSFALLTSAFPAITVVDDRVESSCALAWTGTARRRGASRRRRGTTRSARRARGAATRRRRRGAAAARRGGGAPRRRCPWHAGHARQRAGPTQTRCPPPPRRAAARAPATAHTRRASPCASSLRGCATPLCALQQPTPSAPPALARGLSQPAGLEAAVRGARRVGGTLPQGGGDAAVVRSAPW